MSICHLPISENNTESVVTSSENGSKVLDCEQQLVSHLHEPSTKDLCSSTPVPSQERISSSGMPQEQQSCWMPWDTPGPFFKRSNGSIGWEIIDADGQVIAWTTDEITAERICELLNRTERA